MKEHYEKPEMATEGVELGTLVAQGGSPVPEPVMNPNFGTCPPCL